MCIVCAEVATGAVAVAGIVAQKLNGSGSLARFKARFSSSIEVDEVIIADNLSDHSQPTKEVACHEIFAP
jgi:hypothetical protein